MEYRATPTLKPSVEQEQVDNRPVLDKLASGIQAQGWLKPSDYRDIDAIPDTTIYDPNFNPKDSKEAYSSLMTLKDPSIVKSITKNSINADDFERRVNRAVETQTARENTSWQWQMAGALLTPENFVPLGAASKFGKAEDFMKLARTALSTRAKDIAKSVAGTTATMGAVTAARAASDDTYTAKDAAIDTLFTGGIVGGLEVFSGLAKYRKGVKLQREYDETIGLKKKIDEAHTKRTRAIDDMATARDGLSDATNTLTEITDNAPKREPVNTKAELATKPSVSPNTAMKDSELRAFLTGRMKRNEYRELTSRVGRLGEDAQVDAYAKMQGKLEADTAISRLRTLPEDTVQRLDSHIAAVQAENILFKRSGNVIEGLEPIPAMNHTKLSEAMGRAMDFTATRQLMDKEAAPEMLDRLHTEYRAKWEGIRNEYADLHKRALDSYKQADSDLTALNAKQAEVAGRYKDTTQITFGSAMNGLKEGKVSPLLNWSVGMLNEHKRAMRSPNNAYRKLVSLILHDSVNGGRSAASTKQALFETLVRNYDEAISHNIKQLSRTMNMTIKQASEHVTDLVEGLKLPTTDLERQLMADTSKAFKEALDVVKAFNPQMAKIAHSDNYAPHLAAMPSVRKMHAEGTEAHYIKAMADGIKRMQSGELVEELMAKGLDPKEAREVAAALIGKAAEGYIAKLKRLANITDNADDIALRQKEMSVNGEFIPDIDLNDLIEAEPSLIGRLVTDKANAKNTADRFKTRLQFSMAGEAEGVKIKDLFERDSTALVGRYQHEMSAWAGLADAGIYTPSDVEKLLSDIRAERDTRSGRQIDEDATRAYEYMMLLKGVPLHPDTNYNAVIKSLMAIQYMAKLGMAWIPAVFEYGRPLAMMTTDAARSLPVVSDLGRWIHRKASIKEVKDFSYDVNALMNTRHRVSSIMRNQLDPNEDALSHKLARGIRDTADTWGRLNLMEPVDRLWRASSIDAFHSRMVKHLVNDDKLARGIDLEYIGYNTHDAANLKQLMKDTAFKEDGVWHVDFDAWPAKEKYQYMVALDRAGNRFIQKGYLGENAFERVPPIIRMLIQFRGFVLTGIGKQFTADIAAAERQGITGYGDLAFNWLFMAMTTQLGLEARARIQYAGDPDYDAKVREFTGGDNAMANMIYNHPALGGMRTLMDMSVGTVADKFGYGDDYNEAMGSVQRNTGLSNTGLIESTPVGKMLSSDIERAIQEPDYKSISALLPSNVVTKVAGNFIHYN